jgi:hypothetical protein
MSRIRSAAGGKSSTGGARKGPSPASFKKLQAQLDKEMAKNGRLAKIKKKATENAAATGMALLQVGVTTITAGVSSVAVAAVPAQHRNKARVARGFGALALAGWGLLRTLNGKNGGHQLAVATGLIAAESVEMGQAYGQKIAANRISGVAGTGPSNVAGVPGEVALTPGASQLGAETRHILPDNDDAIIQAFRERAFARGGI